MPSLRFCRKWDWNTKPQPALRRLFGSFSMIFQGVRWIWLLRNSWLTWNAGQDSFKPPRWSQQKGSFWETAGPCRFFFAQLAGSGGCCSPFFSVLWGSTLGQVGSSFFPESFQKRRRMKAPKKGSLDPTQKKLISDPALGFFVFLKDSSQSKRFFSGPKTAPKAVSPFWVGHFARSAQRISFTTDFFRNPVNCLIGALESWYGGESGAFYTSFGLTIVYPKRK